MLRLRSTAFPSGMASLVVLALIGACSNEDQHEVDTRASWDAEPLQRGAVRRQSDKFSDIELFTQHGERVRFYEDLVRDRAVLINLMYTTCEKICPANSARLAQIYDMLADWMGTDITLLSISIDPEVDTPERLKRYWEVFGAKPGWLFLTGDYDEIDRLRHELGVYDLDPVIDADKTQHSGVLTFGNDRTDRWVALPVLMHAEQLAMTVLRTTRDDRWQGRSGAPRLPGSDSAIGESTGIIQEIELAERRIVIEHQDIPGVMMAMTMAFELEASVDAGSVHAGDEVEFTVTQRDGLYLITRLSALATLAASPGAADFNTYCAACHGARGDGDGPLSALLDPKPARLSDAQTVGQLSDEQLFLAIRDGGPAIGKSAGMGAWGGTLSDSSIRDLVDHIRTLSR